MRVALNGFGRIGRDVVRIIFEENRGIDLVAINTLGELEELKEKYGMNAAAIVKAVKEIL